MKSIILLLIMSALIGITSCSSYGDRYPFIPKLKAASLEKEEDTPNTLAFPTKFSLNDDNPGFLAGTYVYIDETSYTRTEDTLVITRRKDSPSRYTVRRNIVYHRFLDTDEFKPERYNENWTAAYDADHQQLYIISHDLQGQFKPSENKLIIEEQAYTKIE